jgi:hypothetical protein
MGHDCQLDFTVQILLGFWFIVKKEKRASDWPIFAGIRNSQLQSHF